MERFLLSGPDHEHDINLIQRSDWTNVSSTSYQILILIAVEVLPRFVVLSYCLLEI